MIDFKNPTAYKLAAANPSAYLAMLQPMMIPDEEIIQAYKTVRDAIVFTNRRIFAINLQGLTGKKKDISSLPYSKIQAFSVETAGVLDIDSELELWFSGLGKIRFEFAARTDVGALCRCISTYTLK